MYYSEIGRIIEAGLERDRDKVVSFAQLLAKKMAADGEGCTRLFEVQIIHCENEKKAKILAKSVISSNLVKTMIFGSDANCGRILCALGYSGVDFDPEIIDLSVGSEGESITLVKDGVVLVFDEDKATKILSREAVTVVCDMKEGEAEATAWGCDLTYDYVKINGDYRS